MATRRGLISLGRHGVSLVVCQEGTFCLSRAVGSEAGKVLEHSRSASTAASTDCDHGLHDCRHTRQLLSSLGVEKQQRAFMHGLPPPNPGAARWLQGKLNSGGVGAAKSLLRAVQSTPAVLSMDVRDLRTNWESLKRLLQVEDEGEACRRFLNHPAILLRSPDSLAVTLTVLGGLLGSTDAAVGVARTQVRLLGLSCEDLLHRWQHLCEVAGSDEVARRLVVSHPGMLAADAAAFRRKAGALAALMQE